MNHVGSGWRASLLWLRVLGPVLGLVPGLVPGLALGLALGQVLGLVPGANAEDGSDRSGGVASAGEEAEAPRSAATVILISLDGARPADLLPTNLPSLVAAGRRGAVMERLIPGSPSNTFPNHVTLVTGVSPARHGLVNNVFADPEKGVFKKRNIPDWIDVEPLWSILAGAGVTSASFYWVGSEGPWRSGPCCANRALDFCLPFAEAIFLRFWLEPKKRESVWLMSGTR